MILVWETPAHPHKEHHPIYHKPGPGESPNDGVDYDFLDAILSVRRIDAAATTTISLPETDTDTPYFPETPWAFRDTLFASATTERLAILAGGVPQRLVNYLRRYLPVCDIPSLLRQLRYTLLEHQFQTWITRNEAQPIRDYKPSYARPKRPTRPSSPLRTQAKTQRRKSASIVPRRTPGTSIANSGNDPKFSSLRRPKPP